MNSELLRDFADGIAILWFHIVSFGYWLFCRLLHLLPSWVTLFKVCTVQPQLLCAKVDSWNLPSTNLTIQCVTFNAVNGNGLLNRKKLSDVWNLLGHLFILCFFSLSVFLSLIGNI